MTRNIGLKVKEPKRECNDKHCPFHGELPIRGKLFDGKVTGNKAKQTITLQKDAPVSARYFVTLNPLRIVISFCVIFASLRHKSKLNVTLPRFLDQLKWVWPGVNKIRF